jgi:alpha-beta hydrolase superfamily lysophospholipase
MTSSITRKSMLIRGGLYLFAALGIVAAISLVLEWLRFTQSQPDHAWSPQFGRLVGLVLVNLLFSVGISLLTALYLWVRMASGLPDLQGWHLDYPKSEFQEADERPGYMLEDYFEQENRVFVELNALAAGPWAEQAEGAYSKYCANSVSNPDTIVDRNWNRSLLLKADNPIGGVLLVHGLSDSPYSVRTLGLRLHNEGYTVLWLRAPGHGTNPGALTQATAEDWSAAVRVAMRGLRDNLPAGAPLVLGGYSNGGALSVLYAISAINDPSLPRPSAIVLLAPMIGINPLASLTRLYHTVAVVSRNQKAQWSQIDAEFDPFRYGSWPMNASVQAWRVTQRLEKGLAKLEAAGRMSEMPPIFAAQSVVDSTIVVGKLITTLFDRLKNSTSELLLYDINRVNRLANLFNRSFEKSVFPKLQRTDLPYRLTLLTNASPESNKIVVQSRYGAASTCLATEMAWSEPIVSLSHLAVPIPPEDPIYGTKEATEPTGLSLGTLSVRTEPGALLINNALFSRCRYNPFYAFTEDRIIRWLEAVVHRK